MDIGVTSDRSGYNTPSMFFMNGFIGAEQDKYINGYAVIDIVLSDGTEETPYLIKNRQYNIINIKFDLICSGEITIFHFAKISIFL